MTSRPARIHATCTPQVAKIVTKLGFAASFVGFKIQNVVATGDCGFPVRLEGLADKHHKWSSVSRPRGVHVCVSIDEDGGGDGGHADACGLARGRTGVCVELRH